MLSAGQGCPQDRKQVVYWWTKAAEQGGRRVPIQPRAHVRKGVGVEADIRQAATWIRKAAEQGIAIAQIKLWLFHATARLSKADIVEAYAWFMVAARSGNEAAQANREHAESMMSAQELREGKRRAEAITKEMASRTP